MKKLLVLSLLFFSLSLQAQQIALLKYEGGGDWYANPTSLPNLIKFCNSHIHTSIKSKPAEVEADDPEIFKYPFVHMTGHGNVFFSPKTVENLRAYLKSGGFLHIDDNYGMKKYVVPEIKKLFPQEKLIELSADHPIFSQTYKFPKGLPKIHVHHGKPPQAFGIFHEGRLVLLFTTETDLGDGWEDQIVHHDPYSVRIKALKMGANIIEYVFTH